MPSNRAILADIEERDLPTNVPVTAVGKDGRLVQLKKAGDVLEAPIAPVSEPAPSVDTTVVPEPVTEVQTLETAPETSDFPEEVDTSVEVPQTHDKPRRGRRPTTLPVVE